jgi:hypothetical protein
VLLPAQSHLYGFQPDKQLWNRALGIHVAVKLHQNRMNANYEPGHCTPHLGNW